MPIISSCCCFNTLASGSRACALFTMITGVINFVIDVAGLVRLSNFVTVAEPQNSFLYIPPGYIPLIYIELSFSIGLIVLGIILLIGINFQHDGERFIKIWIIGVIFDRCYDFFLGVYVLAWAGGHRLTEMIFVIPESIVVTVYWLLNTLILIAALLCVASYWQELLDDLYGKQRRLKYFSKMANLRHAALSGNATPFRSNFGSKQSVMLSAGAVNQGYNHKY